jgi:hypothetical protein
LAPTLRAARPASEPAPPAATASSGKRNATPAATATPTPPATATRPIDWPVDRSRLGYPVANALHRTAHDRHTRCDAAQEVLHRHGYATSSLAVVPYWSRRYSGAIACSMFRNNETLCCGLAPVELVEHGACPERQCVSSDDTAMFEVTWEERSAGLLTPWRCTSSNREAGPCCGSSGYDRAKRQAHTDPPLPRCTQPVAADRRDSRAQHSRFHSSRILPSVIVGAGLASPRLGWTPGPFADGYGDVAWLGLQRARFDLDTACTAGPAQQQLSKRASRAWRRGRASVPHDGVARIRFGSAGAVPIAIA